MNSLKLVVGKAKEMTNQGLRWPVKEKSSGATIKTTRTRDDARKFIHQEVAARSPEATS